MTLAVDPSQQAGATTRTAVVHVPSRYDPQRATPLLLEFHGSAPNATAEGYEAGSPLHALSDSMDFIDVFPQGLRAPNGNLAWNAYGPVFWKVAELPFIDALLSRIESELCVDTARVYASGISNGGNMINYLACREAARFAAVNAVVGPMYGQDDGPCRPSRAVPWIDIHSTNDPVVPYDGHPGPPAYDFPLASVQDWLAGWAELDGCPGKPPAGSAGTGASVQRWSGCNGGAQLVAYTTQAGHGWPRVLDGRAAADVVWSFLSGFTLPHSTAS